MDHFDYKAVPAPRRSKKAKGVREPAELFALTLTDAINEQSREGWEYVRAETLPAETPRGFFRRAAEEEVTMLVFRRERVSREPRIVARETLVPAMAESGAEPRPAPLRPEPAFSSASRGFEDETANPMRREPRISPESAGRTVEFASPLRPMPRLETAEPS